VSTVLDWIEGLVGPDSYNMDNCGVTTKREQQKAVARWLDGAKRFFQGRQVYAGR